jgi:hypothetical protein
MQKLAARITARWLALIPIAAVAVALSGRGTERGDSS